MGHGALSLFLSAEGKIQSLFWAIKIEGGIVLLTPSTQSDFTYDLIEKYHFAEAFETQKQGPVAGFWRPSADRNEGHGTIQGQEFLGHWRNTEFKFDLKSAPLNSDSSSDYLRHRILNLIPSSPEDFDSSTLVFDVGLEDLCDPGKGCYIGQEVVERVRTRSGAGPRQLVTVRLTKSVLSEGDQTIALAFGKRSAATKQ